jgi:hypothetical protein
LGDVDSIVRMAEQHFQCEIDEIFTPTPNLLAKNVAVAIVRQNFDALDQQVIVAERDGTVIAWAWIVRGVFVTYAPEELADARFAHVDLALPERTRITLLAQILQQWEAWAMCNALPVISSSTVREDQTAFLKLHRMAGYVVRGSCAYKRIN